MNFFDKIRGSGPNKSSNDTDALWTTPWVMRDTEGVYTGSDRSVWLYRALPLLPVQWEDPGTQLNIGQRIASMLAEIGATSNPSVSGLRQLSSNREIHLVSVSWDEEPVAAEGTPTALASYLKETLEGMLVPKRTLIVGVRLRAKGQNRSDTLIEQAKKAATKLLLEDVPDRAAYVEDRDAMSSIIARFEGRKLTRNEQAQLESWYNLGRGTDVTIVERNTSLDVADLDSYEMSAVMRFGNPVMYAPNSRWILDSLSHIDAPKIVSVRAELEPAVVTRSRARKAQRRVDAQMKEEAATGDLERIEYSTTYQQAQEFERFLVEVGEPILSNCSILLGRSLRTTNETYIDFLRNSYEIEVKPLEHRQLRALDETLPASPRRINPFVQDVSISMLAYAGLNGFSNLGDPKGAYIGVADPDLTPVYLDPAAAPARNMPPGMLVAGDPGSGKTFLCQQIALQATLSGAPTIFINPKGFDSLAPLAELVNGQVVKMSALAAKPGAFDPFRYAPPAIAAEIATTHILSVLGNQNGFSQAQALMLGAALREAASSGARCVADSFKYINDQDIVTQIVQQVQGSSLFALGVALEPWPEFPATGGLTLVEFDRRLDLPDPGKDSTVYTRAEQISLAAVRLVARASLEILMKSGGGVLIVDEAWTFLGFPEGLAAMQSIGREGRSLNILPVFATQRIADIVSRDMEGYLSRVFCLKLKEPREAKAALELCKLEPTPERIAWLSNCGPQPATEDSPARPPRALHRDLDDRHAAVILGPTPDWVYEALTTNPAERKAILERRKAGRNDGRAK